MGALARKVLKQEVFARIRGQARTNYLEARADKLMLKYARIMKSSHLRKAFSKWRANNFSHMVMVMEEKQEFLAVTKEN